MSSTDNDTSTGTETTGAPAPAATDAKLGPAEAAALARSHGLSLGDSVALRGLTAVEAAKVVAASGAEDPMTLAAKVGRR